MRATRGAVTLIDDECSKGAILDGIAVPRPPNRVGRARSCLSRSLTLRRPVKAGMKGVLITSSSGISRSEIRGMVRIR